MSVTFRLPDLGEGLHEAELVAWHVGVGDRVVADQPLCSVETDKAVVEVPAPQSGQIEALFVEPGAIVPVGEPLVAFRGEEDDQAEADAGSVLDLRRDVQSPKGSRAPRAKVSPAVRMLARSLGVDLSMVAGSGPDGVILKSDVEAAADSGGAAADIPVTASDSAAGEAGRPSASQGTPLRRVRRTMMQKMVRAGHEVVPATISDEADIEDWTAHQDLTARLIRAVAAGCTAAPSLNAWFDSAAEALTVHDRVDLAIAVDTEDGLFAPVIPNVGERGVAELREALNALKADVATRSVPRSALTGGTITLSNFGMLGGRFASLVVVPPQVAILGAGRAGRRVVPDESGISVRLMLPLSLTFDHRVVTGAEATRFLNAAIDDLAKAE